MEILNKYIYDPKLDMLGRGGFATVYRAHDKILDMPVALKFFHPQEGSGKYNIINEIRRAIVLSHPNIVKYFGVESMVNRDIHGVEEEVQIGVMEYVQEGQMKEFLLRQPLMHSELAELLVGVLEGLKYLHSQGIIHRDIKPQNILLGRDKQDKLIAKIADFGISKNVDSSHTSSSLLLGTVEYMAPEQFNPERYGIGKRVSYNVDIWAFGVTAYALLCGRPLFGARSGETSPGELINKIVNVENLEEQLRQLQEPFRTLIARCVIPDAKSRTSNIDELIGILKGTGAPAVHNLHATVSVNLNGFPSAGGQETVILPKQVDSEETAILPKPEPFGGQKEKKPIAKVAEREIAREEIKKTKEPKDEIKHIKKGSSSKKSIFFIAILLLLSTGGVAYYYPAWKDQKEKEASAAAEKEAIINLLNEIDKKMITVDGGKFIMGTNSTQNESPAHHVAVETFRLMNVEVTRGLWNRVMKDNRFTDSTKYELPANNVSWNEAHAFIDKLNQLNAKSGSNKALFRLPKEKEWEYAYYYMDDSTNLGLNEFSWNIDNARGTLHPVGGKQITGKGFYDMLGNVYEWCEDWYGPYEQVAKEEGKVLRGGDYKNDIYFVSPKIRNVEAPDQSAENIGFRIAQNNH